MHPYEQYVNPILAKRLHQLNMDKVFRQGTGCELTDETGERYLDFIASYGALPFGYNHPDIWAAINEVQASMEPSMVQPSYLAAAGELAQELVKVAPAGIKYVTFANSGAEANEAAFKMARVYTKRLGILTTENSFHGKTLGALSATGKDSYQRGFGAPVAGFDRIPYADLNRLEEALKKKPDYYAAFIVEPIQGEGGIIVPPEGYLRDALEICHRYGVLLIVDEVQSGLGRTGRMFACEAEGITPDIITVAKALGGGIVPIGACLCTEEVYSEDFSLKHSSTFAGNTLACRVGLKVLQLLTADRGRLLKEVASKGKYLLKRLTEIQKRYSSVIAAVRGKGLMLGLELGVSQDNLPGTLLGIMADQEFLSPVVASYLLNVEKIRVAPTLNGADVIRLEPPLIISETDCQKAMDAIERMASCLATGNSASFLSHLVRRTLPETPQPKLVIKEPVRPSGHPEEGRFAFLVHPLYLKNYLEFDRTLEAFSESELQNLVERWNDMVEPFVVGKTRITSKTGAAAYGEFICVSRTSEQLMTFPKEQIQAELEAAVKLAKERGAGIVGLGAYTSVVTKGGRDLRNLGVALTTGNSYTVAAAVEATLEAARRLETPIEQTVAAVVGATGSIGRTTAILLAEKVNSLILIGNPLNEEHSKRRLMKLTAEIYQHLNEDEIKGGGAIYRFVKDHPETPSPGAPLEEYQKFAETVREVTPVIYTIELEHYLPQADVVVTATSQVNSLITPAMLKFGAVVCDVSRPPDVSYEVKDARPDVLVIDGGVMAVPGAPDLGWDFGFERGQAYACMSETMMLALEHHYQHFGLGIDINVVTVSYTKKLAEKHGFKLAGFRSFDRPLSGESWEKVIKARSRPNEPSVVSL
ncbi:MAG: aminotransferase class III-fold pyridoxal phosphate-dependent enzyme [Firmicutes bacterium]|nr:aminotransferase class III-fold pyridoxal phosphate-dependent enzyme [Bacillota bacterium]